jgi:alpha-mannosidase
MFQAWVDAGLLNDLMLSLPEASTHRAQLLHGLTEAVNSFKYEYPNPGEIRAILKPYLERKSDGTELTTVAVGHAHIDTAWLWPMRETVRKCARTFSSQLNLLERYPGYVFGASQPQLYQFVKEHYPSLYERIKKAIEDGRWEPQGAMWVEPDTNVPGGESLIRQLLYGKLFFREEFGRDVRNLWLPDVFGYTAALPQLLKDAGVDSLLTQKLSWSQFNRFPHHTFRWRGLDGTEVLTHFPPEDTYNSKLKPSRLKYSAENFEEKGFLPEYITLFGVGDGGGGPKAEYIERGRRMKDLADCPNVRFEAAQPMLDRLQEHWDELSVWWGELYLELHRGTLTTQARNKKLNRECELAFRRTELLYSCLPMSQYPGDILERQWKILLTNQFHDILPGSSIPQVYEDSVREHREILDGLDALTERAIKEIRKPSDGSASRAFSVLNLTSHDFKGALRVDRSLAGALGNATNLQCTEEGEYWIKAAVPALSSRNGTSDTETQGGVWLHVAESVIENSYIRYEFNSEGLLCRVYDKEADQEFIRPGEYGNILSLYEDWPHNFDAWEVDITYEQQWRENATLQNARVVTSGPHVGIVKFDWKIGGSTITQRVRLSAYSRRLDFVTQADWRECRKMLRTAFTVDVAASQANFEVQFGICKRPTHRNTEWDMARFEVCGHRFADISDPQRGVALLNDCKYGYKIHERTLDLNLLRSPWYPDPEADRGHHEFTYSLLPHQKPVEESEVLAESHLLNQPPMAVEGTLDFEPPCRVKGCRTILVENIKKAERSDAWIVRLYEAVGYHSECKLELRDDITEAYESNIMEEEGNEFLIDNNSASLSFRPFEVKTVLLR